MHCQYCGEERCDIRHVPGQDIPRVVVFACGTTVYFPPGENAHWTPSTQDEQRQPAQDTP